MAVSQDPSRRNRKPSPSNSYMRYSGLAIQLFATIALTGWLGYKLDQWLALKFPVFMLIFGMLGFGGSLYQIYRSTKQG